MSSTPTPHEIARDARWLIQALDPGTDVVRMVAMSREAYRGASFLDDRMLQLPVDACLVPWRTVAEATQLIRRRDSRWIFHLGHVGSTLVARLLGELPGVLSVREPRFLRDVAAMAAGDRADKTSASQVLFSRTFDADDVALVKATSFVSEIASELVPPEGRAILMYATPRNYVGSILAGENSVQELRMLAGSRTQRLARREIAFSAPRHDADLAAAAWACEMSSLEAAAQTMVDRRVGWLDFDRFLQEPENALGRSAELLGFPASVDQLNAVANSPLMTRYSKAVEYEYSPALRRDLIADATRRHRSDIDDALAMLNRAAERSPSLARAIERAGEL